MEPITRKELFMAKAGGENVKTPDPITREEMFLQKIAENGGGSGGGGTPNAVQYTAQELTEEQQMQARANLGLYGDGIGEIEIVPETELNFGEGINELSVTIPGAKAGDVYKIKWNGVEYTSEVTENSGSVKYLKLGNEKKHGGEDTGEPFYAVSYAVEDVFDFSWVNSDDNAPATVSIRGEGIVHRQIPYEYLPESVGKAEMVTLFPEGAPAYDEEGAAFALPGVVLEAGKTYVVKYNGVSYTGKASTFDGGEGYTAVVLGNVALLTGTGDTGEPFAISYVEGQGAGIMPLDGSEAPIVEVVGEKVTKIPEKFYDFGIFWVDVHETVNEDGTKGISITTTPRQLKTAIDEGRTAILRYYGTSASSGLASITFLPLLFAEIEPSGCGVVHALFGNSVKDYGNYKEEVLLAWTDGNIDLPFNNDSI